jgi:hypothetical protein
VDALVVLDFFLLHNWFREALLTLRHVPLKLFFTDEPHLEHQTAAFAFGLGFTGFAVRFEFGWVSECAVTSRTSVRRVRLVVTLGRL